MNAGHGPSGRSLGNAEARTSLSPSGSYFLYTNHREQYFLREDRGGVKLNVFPKSPHRIPLPHLGLCPSAPGRPILCEVPRESLTMDLESTPYSPTDPRSGEE